MLLSLVVTTVSLLQYLFFSCLVVFTVAVAVSCCYTYGLATAASCELTKAGYNVILSGCWYLDHLDQTWESFYRCDPSNFTSTRKDLLLGGHASMWAEHVDASNFMSRVWPRASAAAERLWTGNITGQPSKTIQERIHNFRCRMVQFGFDAGPTRPGSCPTEVPYLSRRQKMKTKKARTATTTGSSR